MSVWSRVLPEGLLTVSVERVIPAPADAVFALLADPAAHRTFDGSGTVQDPVGDPGPLVLGSTFGMAMKAGARYRMVNEVVEFEPDRLIAWQPRPDYAVGRAIAGGRIWRYELEPVAGGTLVRETWDVSQEVFPPLVLPLRRLTRANMTRTLARLEEVLTA